MALAATVRPPRCRPRPIGSLAVAFAMLVALAPRSVAGDLDLWFTVEIGGQKAGWQRLTTTTADDRITTRTELRMSVRRGSQTTSFAFITEFVETAAGEPVSMRLDNRTGATPVTTEYTFNAETIESVTRQGGEGGEGGRGGQGGQEPQRSEAPAPEGSWLTPAAARQYVAQRLAAGAGRITLRTMDPALGPQAITVTRDVIEQVRTPVGPPSARHEMQVWRCTVRQSVAEQLHTVEYLDALGVPVITETKLGGLDMRIALSDQQTAQQASPAPEMLVSVFVRPGGRAITAPRRTVEASYLVRTRQGPLPELPVAGAQVFERLGDQSGRVRVSALRWRAAGEVDTAPLLAASPLLDTQDEVLRRLARRATAAAGESAAARAEAMRRFAHQHVRSKSLDVAFASASEVARSREGDCTEHATLLAALLRIEGIPSRVVSGLIYADSFAGQERIFGYHMWTQALLEVDGELCWVDLDPTLPDRAFDAAHIAVSTSDLGATGAMEPMLVVAQLLGNVEIEVEEVE